MNAAEIAAEIGAVMATVAQVDPIGQRIAALLIRERCSPDVWLLAPMMTSAVTAHAMQVSRDDFVNAAGKIYDAAESRLSEKENSK